MLEVPLRVLLQLMLVTDAECAVAADAAEDAGGAVGAADDAGGEAESAVAEDAGGAAEVLLRVLSLQRMMMMMHLLQKVLAVDISK